MANLSFNKITRRIQQVRERGLIASIQHVGIKNLLFYGAYKRLRTKLYRKKASRQLQQILQQYPNHSIIILPPVVDWQTPLFQRNHHMAGSLAKLGYLYFYCTQNLFEDVCGFVEVEKRLFVTDQFQLLKNLSKQVIYHIYTFDYNFNYEAISKLLDDGHKVVYEYVDEIHSDIMGSSSEMFLKRHQEIIKDPRVYCICTAEKLYAHVLQQRQRRLALITNGVDTHHFNSTVNKNIPEILSKIIAKQKIILGYFGAFANWVDYALLESIARLRSSDVEIVMIGYNRDGTINKSALPQLPNVHILGPIDYQQLPLYAQCFTISIIPFKINEVTDSTSPLKLFEYMALGKPIITTGMPECAKYSSALIAADANDFADKITVALQLQDDHNYRATLSREASANDWSSKAENWNNLIKLY